MLQVVHQDKVFWCGTVREVTAHIGTLSKEYIFVKDLINAKLQSMKAG